MDNWNPGERNVRWGARSARTERGRCAGPSEAAAPPRGKCRQGHLRPGHLRPACVVAEPRRTLGVPHRVTSPRDGAPTRPCGPRGRHHWLWYGGTETGAPGAAWAWSPLRAVNALGGRKPRCGRRRLGASPSAGPERCGRRSRATPGFPERGEMAPPGEQGPVEAPPRERASGSPLSEPLLRTRADSAYSGKKPGSAGRSRPGETFVLTGKAGVWRWGTRVSRGRSCREMRAGLDIKWALSLCLTARSNSPFSL